MMTFGTRPSFAETVADSHALHSGPCTMQAASRKVTLEIDPKPVRHMAELTFRVTIDPVDGVPPALLLDLGMPGMAMGKNQVRMVRQKDGTWKGKGIIVRCMSGRTLWQATILSPALGNPAFTINVRD